ncbi:MAG: tetratricopeptide repeat protein [Acidimicrobiales bacterium]
MVIDTTDEAFEQDVLARSAEVPVVVDLWAPWCGPCRTLGPILEKVVEETVGQVALAKVNVDENPQISAAFGVQSIPAVYALRDRKVVDGFIGALSEGAVREFVGRLVSQPSEADELVAKGDEASIRKALELDPDHPSAISRLAELLVERGQPDEALALLQRIPETEQIRKLAAEARLSKNGASDEKEQIEQRLEGLLDRVRGDDEARQEFVDLLETMPADDPRREQFRRALAAQLF